MKNLRITEAMVLAVVEKGIIYELEDCEMEYEINIPLGIFGLEDDADSNIKVDVKMNISKMKFEITKS